MQTKINVLVNTIHGAETLFLAGEYADCVEELVHAYCLESACIHGYYNIPPCRDMEIIKDGKTTQVFVDVTYIYHLGERLLDIRMALRDAIKNNRQFADFLPIGPENDEYYFPDYKR